MIHYLDPFEVRHFRWKLFNKNTTISLKLHCITLAIIYNIHTSTAFCAFVDKT